ncbi:MAG: DUF4249 domain-containing protein [Prolixibacteraceae bacterium]|nr:DUF4249 domain-containing protein [Prolixibacteraceae bacterium]
MNRRKNILTTLSLLLLFTACEKTIEFNEEDVKPLLVVNCILTEGENIEIDLTHTVHALEESDFFEPVKNASITISDGDKISSAFVFTLKFDSILRWNNQSQTEFYEYFEKSTYINTEFEIKAGQKYILDIDADNYEPITAEAIMPVSPKISKIDTTSELVNDAYSSYIERNAKITFTDPPNEQNFYQLMVKKAEVSVYFDHYTGEMILNPWVTESFISSEDPIFEKDESDIIGGLISSYLPLFIFEDALINGKTYTLSFNYDNVWVSSNYYYPEGAEEEYKLTIYKIMLNTLDESMYKYKQTSIGQTYMGSDPFSEPVLVYSNIENGAGVFGGYNEEATYIMTNNFSEELMEMFPEGDAEKLFNYINEESQKQRKY